MVWANKLYATCPAATFVTTKKKPSSLLGWRKDGFLYSYSFCSPSISVKVSMMSPTCRSL